ncbi:MAG: aldehyde ferredoxin oxidoreductase [Clostridia bacterium]|nr:aldehyde ferredoxin oxidoreductase [Clostridia bacterium]
MSVKNGIYGWAGQIARINLTTGEVTKEDTLPKYKPFIGGMGLGYKVIWDEVPLETDALAPESKVVFGVGPLTASGVPCSGRLNISFLSNWSKGNSIVDAHMGGHFAHAMKYAGYDAIILEGQSDKPVYIKIDDENITLEDASHVWGTGTFNTNKVIAAECGDTFDVCSIGQAGENLVPMSTIITSVGNSGGAGIGAILGSKKVKALAARGTGAVKIAEPIKLRELSNYMIKDLVGGNNNHNVPSVPQSWAEYSATSKNRWQGGPGVVWGKAPNGPVDTGEQPSGQINVAAMRCNKGVFDFGHVAEKWTVKQGGCSSCPVRCYTEYEMDPLADFDLPTHVSNTCMPIISGKSIFPGKSNIHDFVDEGDAGMILGGSMSRAQDEYGVWCNYGNVYSDFYRLYNDGILKEHFTEEEWNEVNWQYMLDGDPRWAWEFFKHIAEGKGVWADLGMGSYYLYQKWGLDDATKNSAGKNYYDEVIGKNTNVTYNGYPKHHSSEDAWQSGLLYNAMYNRDCMIHHCTNFVRSGSPYEEVIKPVLAYWFGEGATDAPKKYTPINDAKIRVAKWSFLGKQWHDSATLCNWMYPMTLSTSKKRNYIGDLDLDAKYMSAVTGEEYTRESIDFDCERISHLLRAMTAISFKINLGSDNLRKDHDAIPAWVFDKEPDFKAFEEGTVKMDRDDMEKAFTMFYEAMGWDTETGIPTRETLEKYDLADVADKLASYGLIK